MAAYASVIERYDGWDAASSKLLELVVPLHNIGKIRIPVTKLRKPANHTDYA